jgi:hypothetical protein
MRPSYLSHFPHGALQRPKRDKGMRTKMVK